MNIAVECIYVFRNMYLWTYTFMYVTAISEKRAMNLKENKDGYMGGFVGKKGKR